MEESYYIDTFGYENLYQEYDFKTGDTKLYLVKDDGQRELLYESAVENDLENSSFYSPNSAFVMTEYNKKTDNIRFLDRFPKTSFIKFMQKFDRDYKFKFLKNINETISILSAYKQSTRLIADGVYTNSSCNSEIITEYRHLFVKYKCSAAYIPVYCILEYVIDDINSYIASGQLDIITIKRRYSELQNFEKICPTTCALISSFINNPDSTDLRSLCDSLEKNLNNIDKLLNMYMEDELNLQQTRGENDDCK